jgi:hypothetical protein
MAINGQFSSETSVNTDRDIEFEVLQAILVAQGDTVSYEEAADISYQLLEFFKAFGDDNEEAEDSHA